MALFACAFVVGSAGLGAGAIADIRSMTDRLPREGTGELVASSRACQTFVAQYNGLSQVEVMLHDFGRENSGPFYFYLRGVPDASEDILSLTHDAADVEYGKRHLLEFAPIRDSAGRAYAFCLEAPEAPVDNAITAIGMLDDWYPDGEAVFRDMWGKGAGVQDLDFVLGYRLALPTKLRVLSERLVANKPFLCGAGWFYVLLGLAYLALLYGLLARFLPAPGDTDNPPNS